MRHEVREVQAADRLVPAPARPRNGTVRVVMIGDVIGKPGREGVERLLPGLRDERNVDFVTANGENLAGGMGLTASTAQALFAAGVDVITSGNHIWDKREIYAELDREERILRPLNYGHDGVPGRGWGIFHAADGSEIAVINAQGRTYMQPTGDERILPRGTAYLTDIGMTGPVYSVIGFEPRTVLPRFLNGLPTRFEVGSGPVVFNAVQIDIDTASGRALHVERVSRMVEA